MDDRDSLGRRRRPSQNRGLRPLYPPLPRGVRSRSVRVSMTQGAWERLDELTAASTTTAPRTIGELVESALAKPPGASVTDWLQWQIRKEQRLLAS